MQDDELQKMIDAILKDADTQALGAEIFRDLWLQVEQLRKEAQGVSFNKMKIAAQLRAEDNKLTPEEKRELVNRLLELQEQEGQLEEQANRLESRAERYRAFSEERLRNRPQATMKMR